MQALRAFAARSRFSGIQAQIRKFSTEPGVRERILLEDDPHLRPYKSSKGTVKAIRTFGDVLVVLVVAESVYEIAYRAQVRKAARAGAAEE